MFKFKSVGMAGWPLARLWLTLSAAESFVSAKESTASSASSRSLRHHLDQHAAASTDLCCLGYQWYLQSRLSWIYMESRSSKRWRKQRCFRVLLGASSTCIAPTMKAAIAGAQAPSIAGDTEAFSSDLIAASPHHLHCSQEPKPPARAFWVLCSPSCCKSVSSSRSKAPGQWKNALKSLSSEINLQQGVVQ